MYGKYRDFGASTTKKHVPSLASQANISFERFNSIEQAPQSAIEPDVYLLFKSHAYQSHRSMAERTDFGGLAVASKQPLMSCPAF